MGSEGVKNISEEADVLIHVGAVFSVCVCFLRRQEKQRCYTEDGFNMIKTIDIDIVRSIY